MMEKDYKAPECTNSRPDFAEPVIILTQKTTFQTRLCDLDSLNSSFMHVVTALRFITRSRLYYASVTRHNTLYRPC